MVGSKALLTGFGIHHGLDIFTWAYQNVKNQLLENGICLYQVMVPPVVSRPKKTCMLILTGHGTHSGPSMGSAQKTFSSMARYAQLIDKSP